MKGILMALRSLGINIEPAEVEAFYNHMRVMIPQVLGIVKALAESIDSRLADIEANQRKIRVDLEELRKGFVMNVSNDPALSMSYKCALCGEQHKRNEICDTTGVQQ